MLGSMMLMLAAPAAASAPVPAAMEIRFCPEKAVRAYPLDSLRGLQGLLSQGVAIVNRTSSPVKLDSVTIELRDQQRIIDKRTLDAKAISGAVASGQGVKQQGLMDAYPFQFCDGRLLGKAALASGDTLAPGQALLVMQQAFAYKGARTDLAVDVRSSVGGAATSIPIVAGVSKTEFAWPLRGRPAWTVAAGAGFHTTHRWAVPEEFALDIISVGEDGRSFRTDAAGNADFYAYGTDVLAAADGKVVRLITGAKEEPPLLRAKDETMEAYYGRIGRRQLANVALGAAGLLGDSIVIDHHNGEYSVYAHLKRNSMVVKKGELVRKGQPIGKLGSSGNSTEPHLHFQVCDGADGLSCAGIPPQFTNIVMPMADGPRPIQSGDVVTVAD